MWVSDDMVIWEKGSTVPKCLSYIWNIGLDGKMVRTRSQTSHASPAGKMAENGSSPSSVTDMEGGKEAHKALGVMFISLVIDLLAFTMILPLLPAILDHYGKHDQVS